ncbi:MAG: hypothetical protein HW416_725 [Chloroflexi bacterium]|nr:hypothetical protein [Chloroflexota bacterium]
MADWQVNGARRWLTVAAATIMTFAGCASPGPGAPTAPSSRGGTDASQTTGPKGTLRLAWFREPEILSPKFFGGSGNGDYQWLFSSTLIIKDLQGVPHPLMAQEIPTQSNGGWVINPNGTMVTTYKLRPNAQWHDGTPVTARDYIFAHEVYTDADLPVQTLAPEPLMSRLEAPDDYTLVIHWKEAYINANILSHQQLNPLPRHLQENKYRTDKANFMNGSEWTTTFIGTGPFKLERWNPGTGMIGRAHTGWALGQPKLDTLDIRFIADPSTQLANLLAGEVDMINSPGVRAQEAAVARDRWATSGEGYVKTWTTRTAYVEWQFREVANWQRAVLDMRVRQALYHSIDRKGIAETVNLGFAPAADTFISSNDPLFAEVDRVITKYPFDPNRSLALLAEAGWQRGSGGQVADASGRTLDMDLATTASQEDQATIIVDNWKAAGVNTKLFVIPQARARDGELRSSFAAASTNGRTIGPDNFVWLAEEFPTTENRWIGSNRGSFSDPEIERLHHIRVASLDESQRRQATVDVLKRMTEVAGPLPFIYSVEAILARKNVVGPVGNYGPQEGMSWNVHDWEVQ